MADNNIQGAVDFFFELGQLKRERHNGFLLSGVREPDTVAEHAWRAAQIGFVLAELENARAGEEVVSAERVACMLLIHDNAETRLGDQHKVAARYVDLKGAEAAAFADQLNGLGERVAGKWEAYRQEYESRATREGIVAKDADWLETALQAKEYLDLGYASTQDFIDNVAAAVETQSAKELVAALRTTQFTDWWKGLKKMTYRKLERGEA